MKNKYLKYIFLLIVIAFIIPQITLASWWNPFTWNWNIFSWFTKPQVVVPVIPVSTLKNQTASWKTYTNTKYEYQINYPNGWITDVNLFSYNNTGEGDVVFCPPELQQVNNSRTICRVDKTNGGSINPKAPISLFQCATQGTDLETCQRYKGINLGTNQTGQYFYELVLNDQNYSATYNQMPSTFKFINQKIQSGKNYTIGPDGRIIRPESSVIKITPVKFQGTVKSINPFTAYIDGKVYTIDLFEKKSYDQNGLKISFNDIKIGDKISFGGYFLSDTDNTISTLSVIDISIHPKVESKIYQGVVKSINPFRMIIDGVTYNISLPTDASYPIFGDKGNNPIYFTDIKIGDTLSVGGMLLNNTISAFTISDLSINPTAQIPRIYKGIISNINASSKSFTLTIDGIAYTVISSDINGFHTANQSGNPILFTEVKNGDSIEVYGTITNTTITTNSVVDFSITDK